MCLTLGLPLSNVFSPQLINSVSICTEGLYLDICDVFRYLLVVSIALKKATRALITASWEKNIKDHSYKLNSHGCRFDISMSPLYRNSCSLRRC